MSEQPTPSQPAETPAITTSNVPAQEVLQEENAASATGSSWLTQLALFIALAAAIAMAWQWYHARQRFAVLEQELSQKLEQFNGVNQQALALARNADERSTEVSARASLFEQKLAESRDQAEALQTLYVELANNREERTIAEVEQLIIIANQQLQLAGNIKPALLALQTADTRLQHLDSSQVVQLRKSIGHDIQRLQNMPQVDTVGISLKLENLAETISTLPLVSERHPQSAPALAPEWDSNPWRRLAQEVWQDLRTMIRLERIDRPEPPLLAPEQNFFLRENIKLHLLTARIALLQHDEATYRADLLAAEKWLKSHFDPRDSGTQLALNMLKELSSKEIVIDLPDVNESLSLVSKYKLSLERLSTPAKSNTERK
jgi:uroporphyrin-III C-methyltransferase